MHVRTKKMATAGLLVAFSIIMMLLSSIIETSSLFFIAAASFCVGIAVREWGLRLGFAFLCASVILNFLITPSKLYCFTLLGMGFYIWASEWIWHWIANKKVLNHREAFLWAGKYIIFNVLYVPTLFCAPQLLFTGKINGLFATILFLLGQIALLIYDAAYQYFQGKVWGKVRVRFMQNKD